MTGKEREGKDIPHGKRMGCGKKRKKHGESAAEEVEMELKAWDGDIRRELDIQREKVG